MVLKAMKFSLFYQHYLGMWYGCRKHAFMYIHAQIRKYLLAELWVKSIQMSGKLHLPIQSMWKNWDVYLHVWMTLTRRMEQYFPFPDIFRFRTRWWRVRTADAFPTRISCKLNFSRQVPARHQMTDSSENHLSPQSLPQSASLHPVFHPIFSGSNQNSGRKVLRCCWNTPDSFIIVLLPWQPTRRRGFNFAASQRR